MDLLTKRGWQSGYPPYFRHDGQVRIEVRGWLCVYPIEDAFVTYHSDWRTIANYVGLVGLRETLRKARSRMAESDRNRKCLAVGWGVVREAPAESAMAAGDEALLVAPFHPYGVSEVCLHEPFVRPAAQLPARFNDPAAVWVGKTELPGIPWERLAGWSPWSGSPLDREVLEQAQRKLAELAADSAWSPVLDRHPVRRPETSGADETPPAGTPSFSGRKQAVIFGMGQYTKVQWAPRIGRYMDIACWHEIDPAQVGPLHKYTVPIRTSDHLEPDEKYDVHFIAGFHHLHATQAIDALEQGATAVVEKPLATTHQQLDDFLKVARRHPERTFLGYHRRYSPLNEYLRRDLGLGGGRAVSLSAIAYEIPLPPKHWYWWPNSRGRIVCNGCHWIDYFLWLNDFSPPAYIEAGLRANGDTFAMMDLANGASLTMTITELGASTIGMRDVQLISCGDRSARIVDERDYLAESGRRVLRRAKLSRTKMLEAMFDTIGRRVAAGEPGDSLQSLEVSARAVLDAQEQMPG